MPFLREQKIGVITLFPPFRAYCKDCGAEGPDSTVSPEMAKRYWNTAGCPGQLTWTKSQPTKPEFYFIRPYGPINAKNIQVVKIEALPCISETGWKYNKLWIVEPTPMPIEDREALWAGPIPEPVEVKDAK